MIDEIKKYIFQKYQQDEKKGVFFSGFDSKWKLIFSTWIITTEKSLEEVIDKLYKWIIQKHESKLDIIVIDIVDNIVNLSNPQDILSNDMKKYWFVLESNIDDNCWVLLPNTEWIADAKHALAVIKQKNNLSWKVSVYSISTTRFAVAK